MATVARTLRPLASPGYYPRLSAVEAIRRAMGCEPSTAAQYLKPTAPECPFTRAARIAEALLAAGHVARLDALCLPLDLVRQAPLAGVTRTDWLAATEAEQTSDGAEDVAQLFVQDVRLLCHVAKAEGPEHHRCAPRDPDRGCGLRGVPVRIVFLDASHGWLAILRAIAWRYGYRRVLRTARGDTLLLPVSWLTTLTVPRAN